MAEGKNEDTKKKVMVAIDESDCSLYAFTWALDRLGPTLQNSHLLIFTAQPIVQFGYAYASSYGATPFDLIGTIQEKERKVALALLEKTKEICARHGILAETITEVGDPKEVICQAVDKLNVELLVLGSHGRGAIERAFLGSVSNYCIHNANCPVLVVKKPV